MNLLIGIWADMLITKMINKDEFICFFCGQNKADAFVYHLKNYADMPKPVMTDLRLCCNACYENAKNEKPPYGDPPFYFSSGSSNYDCWEALPFRTLLQYNKKNIGKLLSKVLATYETTPFRQKEWRAKFFRAFYLCQPPKAKTC